MIKKFIAVIIVLILILGGVYGWHKFMAYEGAKYMAKFAMPASSVSVVKAAGAQWHTLIPAVGSTVANEGTNVSSEVGGQITRVFFKSGDIVQQGQPIVQLNPDILQAQLTSDQASLNYAKLSYLRQKALVAQGASSAADLDQALATYREDLAAAEQVQAQLAQTFIRAPFSGVLGITQVSLGDYIRPGQAIVSLQALQPMTVNFNVPENQAAAIQVGDEVTLTTVAYPNQVFSGKVVAADSVLDTNTSTLQFRANVDNPKSLLLPGMFATINVVMPKTFSVVVIPQIAVNYSSIGDYVYVVQGDVAHIKYISLGERRDDQIAVTGLTVGDEVIYAGQIKLHQDGAKVVVEKGEK